jgi:hypothetical protein
MVNLPSAIGWQSSDDCNGGPAREIALSLSWPSSTSAVRPRRSGAVADDDAAERDVRAEAGVVARLYRCPIAVGQFAKGSATGATACAGGATSATAEQSSVARMK